MAGIVAELVGVERHYRLGDADVRALAGVDLAFEDGDYAAIMGPSGSGKSTLLNVLGCLDRPTSGVYRLGDKDRDRYTAIGESDRMTLRFVKVPLKDAKGAASGAPAASAAPKK